MFKVNNKTPERSQSCRCDFYIVNFEHISRFFLVSLFGQVNVS